MIPFVRLAIDVNPGVTPGIQQNNVLAIGSQTGIQIGTTHLPAFEQSFFVGRYIAPNIEAVVTQAADHLAFGRLLKIPLRILPGNDIARRYHPPTRRAGWQYQAIPEKVGYISLFNGFNCLPSEIFHNIPSFLCLQSQGKKEEQKKKGG